MVKSTRLGRPDMDQYMKIALDEAYEGIENGDGGPFGAVIVKDGKVIGKGHNRVVKNADPTCHGEMEAIRDACRRLGTFDLSGSTIYTTGEPCPMCLGAIMWANIEKVYYGCDVKDTEAIGFRDDKFYELSKLENKRKFLAELDRDECLKLYAEYMRKTNKTAY